MPGYTPKSSDVLERFLRYVQVDSQSDPHNEDETPSTACQRNLARLLASELAELGCEDVALTEHAYVTASLPASAGAEGLPALGLIAHVDTAPDAPASGVRPHIVRYEGGELVHGERDGKRVVTTPEELPALLRHVGEDLVCTDGTTLLGADDKAGVAEIVALLARLAATPELPHPCIKVAFVPDEEIGHGAALLDLDAFGATWAYTVDGEELGEFNWECFSASQATVTAHGVEVHPGSAKGVMVNAITLLREFDELLPAAERPEHTEGYEGFFHPIEISGGSGEATLTYIVRDFDAERFAAREQLLRDCAAFLNQRYGDGTVTVEVREQYRNMVERLRGMDFLRDNALDAMAACGMEPRVVPVRGGTDGAQLTLRGLPCPNLPTGGYNFHGVREFIPVRSMELMVDALEQLVGRFAVPQE
ncbi:peptidase T [Parolsenella catena]|uniref:Peptidase T n=1 Tax=Parolsenella catena TaxID=2003188 RepID=A0A3G9JWN2_9ACTN|nr:peptidase T [Parolsenella catena]BBH49773.1 peptidase T [Parolsenella catena]